MAGHQTNSDTILGRQVQWVYATASDGVFEVIPYFSESSIEGVGTGGHSTEELKTLSTKWWAETIATFKRIKVGDRITIGYQGDQRLIGDYAVKRAVGWGSITLHSEKKGAEAVDGNPH